MTAHRLDRLVLRLAGADAHGFLNNLVTNDLARLDEAPILYAGLLTPQGKVWVDFFVWRDGADLLIEAPPGDLLAKLTLYKLRAAVTIEDVSAGFDVLFDDGGGAHGTFSAPDPRLPTLGSRSLVAKNSARPDGAPKVLLAHRLTIGVPELSEDAAPGEVFALEALFEELNGVDFQKGCFIGQENVSRMKRRATTRRKFCPLLTDGIAPPGAPVMAGEIVLGDVRAAVHGRALALLRLDRALEAVAQGVPMSAGGQPVRLDPPPWLIAPSLESA